MVDQHWADTDPECDVTRLLTLIRDGLYQNATNPDKTRAMIKANEGLKSFVRETKCQFMNTERR